MAATAQTSNPQHAGQTGLNGASAEESFRLLEAQIKDLQDEVAFSSVKIGVTTFTSRTQTKAWMDRTNYPKLTEIWEEWPLTSSGRSQSIGKCLNDLIDLRDAYPKTEESKGSRSSVSPEGRTPEGRLQL